MVVKVLVGVCWFELGYEEMIDMVRERRVKGYRDLGRFVYGVASCEDFR